jgi:hypothetical protein
MLHILFRRARIALPQVKSSNLQANQPRSGKCSVHSTRSDLKDVSRCRLPSLSINFLITSKPIVRKAASSAASASASLRMICQIYCIVVPVCFECIVVHGVCKSGAETSYVVLDTGVLLESAASQIS